MKLIRIVLGAIILFFDRLFTPSSIERSSADQARIDQECKALTLYQLNACPFCVKVRRQMKRLGLKIALRDVAKDPSAQTELMQGGKIDQVPCLKITNADGSIQWMYESDQINEYLSKQFGTQGIS